LRGCRAEELAKRSTQGDDKIFRAGWMYKEGGVVKSWRRR
jgi:hypothetical protein